MFTNHETLQYIQTLTILLLQTLTISLLQTLAILLLQTLTILLLYLWVWPWLWNCQLSCCNLLPPLSLLWTPTSHLYNCAYPWIWNLCSAAWHSHWIYQLIYLLLASILLLNACWLIFSLLAAHFALSLIYILLYTPCYLYSNMFTNPSIYLYTTWYI